MRECGTKSRDSIRKFLKKNFEYGIHYTISPAAYVGKHHGRGGHNKLDLKVTASTAEMLKNTFNMRYKYMPHVGSLKQTNTVMSPENSTIGFICNALKDVTPLVRQQRFGRYAVDLYIPVIHTVVECDEGGHARYDDAKELDRQTFIMSKGCEMLRFDPRESDFSVVMNTLLKAIFATKV